MLLPKARIVKRRALIRRRQAGKFRGGVQSPHMNRCFPLTCLVFCLIWPAAPLRADKPRDGDLTRQIESLLNTPDFQIGFQGVCVVSLRDNRTLYERNADQLFLPASNNKLLTSGAALALLGPRFTYRTRVLPNGPLDRKGVLHGDLILRGGGDPLLSFDDLRGMARQVRQAGIRRVRGKIFYDESRFDRRRLGDGWAWDDAPFDYSAQISSLNLNENVVMVSVSAGDAAGDAVRARIEPNCGYVTLDNQAITARSATDAPFQFDRDAGANRVRLTGSLTKNARRRFAVTVENPAKFSAAYFAFALRRAGVFCATGGAYQKPKRENLRPLISHDSAPLTELLPRMNKPSDNLMAECLLKTIGCVRRSAGSGEAGAAAAQAWLAEIGIDKNAAHLVDGSGLSRANVVSPRAFVKLLIWLYHSPYRRPFFDSLPLAGTEGTLRNRLRETAAQGNCRAKTGTMAHVSCLTGILTTKDGETLAFSILMNNHLAAPKTCQAVQDAIVTLLATYSKANADKISARNIDRIAYGKKGLGYEKLEQMTTELLLGLR